MFASRFSWLMVVKEERRSTGRARVQPSQAEDIRPTARTGSAVSPAAAVCVHCLSLFQNWLGGFELHGLPLH